MKKEGGNMTLVLVGCVAGVISFVYCSFLEWTLHRYLLHSNRFMRYPHRAHQVQHHGLFAGDSTFYLTKGVHSEADEEHLTFAWWNMPLIIFLHAPIAVVIYSFLGGWVAVLSCAIAMAAYYVLYEYLHYCFHVVRNRFFERTRLFRFIQTRHRLHHVYYQKNLNVVVPIADFVLGTCVGMSDPTLFEKIEATRLLRLERANSRVIN